MGSVSVVIPAYNPRPEWLAEAIASAVEQKPAPLEVLVVDDGSDVPVVHDHPLVRVIRQDNTGVAGARNRGVAQARGEFVAFLDQDDVWLPGKVATQLQHTAAGVALVSTGFDLLADDERRRGWGGPPGTYRNLLRGCPVAASTLMVRRGVLQRAGGFDTRLAGVDDWEAWLRVAQCGRLAHVLQVLVLYRTHDGMQSRDYRSMWARSMRVLWKHRRAVPVAGVRRQRQVYGAQAFDSFRATRQLPHLAWASALWPGYVARQALSAAAHAASR